eukprot:m.113416 g.113416  ORF g.113416 m.113416 type:complete len:837 (+) comp13514_c0_seq2:94-2604(+)
MTASGLSLWPTQLVLALSALIACISVCHSVSDPPEVISAIRFGDAADTHLTLSRSQLAPGATFLSRMHLSPGHSVDCYSVEHQEEPAISDVPLMFTDSFVLLRGCVTFMDGGWWAYRVCHGKRVVQYHAVPSQPTVPLDDPNDGLPAVIVLGTGQETNVQTSKEYLQNRQQHGSRHHPEIGSSGYLEIDLLESSRHDEASTTTFKVFKSVTLKQGTPCDLSGDARQVTVNYGCSHDLHQEKKRQHRVNDFSYQTDMAMVEPIINFEDEQGQTSVDAHSSVMDITETATCRYVVRVHVPQLCKHDEGASTKVRPGSTPSHAIQCVDAPSPTQDKQPNAPQSDASDQEANPTFKQQVPESFSAQASQLLNQNPFTFQSTFSGEYTCQGVHAMSLQLFLDPAKRSYKGELLSEALAEIEVVRQPLAIGRFELIGRFNWNTRHLFLVPSRWIYNPSELMGVTIDGHVSLDNQTIQGILPECRSTPFVVHQDAVFVPQYFPRWWKVDTKAERHGSTVNTLKENFQAVVSGLVGLGQQHAQNRRTTNPTAISFGSMNAAYAMLRKQFGSEFRILPRSRTPPEYHALEVKHIMPKQYKVRGFSPYMQVTAFNIDQKKCHVNSYPALARDLVNHHVSVHWKTKRRLVCVYGICLQHCDPQAQIFGTECLAELWHLVGCDLNATSSPFLHTTKQLNWWNSFSLSEIIRDVVTYHHHGTAGVDPYYFYCFATHTSAFELKKIKSHFGYPEMAYKWLKQITRYYSRHSLLAFTHVSTVEIDGIHYRTLSDAKRFSAIPIAARRSFRSFRFGNGLITFFENPSEDQLKSHRYIQEMEEEEAVRISATL